MDPFDMLHIPDRQLRLFAKKKLTESELRCKEEKVSHPVLLCERRAANLPTSCVVVVHSLVLCLKPHHSRLTTHQFTTQVRFETKIVVTDVSEREELLGQIEALSPDLVVVGRRGLGALAKCVVSPVFSF